MFKTKHTSQNGISYTLVLAFKGFAIYSTFHFGKTEYILMNKDHMVAGFSLTLNNLIQTMYLLA